MKGSSLPSLQALAQRRVQRAEREARPGLAGKSVADYVVGLNPGFERPDHLSTLCSELEAAIASHTGKRFFWFSVPPRHWKTETIKGAIIKHLVEWPREQILYVTHESRIANKQSRSLRRLAKIAGIAFADDSNRQDEWETPLGGGIMARGLGASPTGLGFRLIVIDDPFGGPKAARSAAKRDEVFEVIEQDILTRGTPDASAFLVHTRWHPDDAIGRYRARGEPGINIPSLGGENEDVPLLPRVWSREYLEAERQKNPYKFAALYQGAPRPRGANVFNDAHYYAPSALPRSGYRTAYGLDLAYTARTSADWSVLVRLIKHRGLTYVTGVWRRQSEAPAFADAVVASVTNAEPGPIWWYVSGTEKGAAQFIRRKIPRLRVKPATGDKFTRATPAAEAWNQGRIMVPGGPNPPEWVEPFVDELINFTGVGDAHDDQVDGLAAGFDALRGGALLEAFAGET